jgi:PAS domain S-box-containing protein
MAEAERERVWLEKELEELRARETEYRKRAGHDAAVGARLHGYAQTMHQMFRRRPPSREELDGTLLRVARLSAQALSIRRTSVWRFDRAEKRLVCALQIVDDEVISPSGLVLESESCPSYVDALRQDFAVAVDDVRTDGRTQELMPYLKEHDIGALLDIPIAIPGKILGVVCHEHVGSERRWHPREIEFASSVGQLIALALEAERRVRAEHTARGTEAKYQHLVESLPVTVYSFDAKTAALDYVSPRVAELGGLTAEEWLEQGAGAWIRQIHPDDRAPVLERFRVGTGSGFPEELTYRVMLPNDEIRWVRDTCRVIRDPAGEPVGFQGVLVDVTAQTEAELSRREFERRYRSLLENVDLMAVSLDTEGRVTFANEAFLRASGYSLDELIGSDWFETMLPKGEREPVKRRYLDSLRRGRIAPRFELTIVTREGEARRILCTNTLLRAPDGTPVGSSTLALDVTERRKLEHELLLQTKLESLGRLAAGVAHDFNNLITVMVGQMQLLKRSTNLSSDADISHQLATIDQVLGQATELTRSLLTYGRHEESGPLEEASLDEIVRGSMPLLEAMTGQDVRIITSLHSEDAVLKFDRTRMRQVLVNLVANAADATSGRGHSIQVRTHVEFLDERDARAKGAKEGGEFTVLTVADEGRGMAPTTVAQVFEPFFTTKAEGRGTGLGLAITQSIVSHMGGFTTVESELGVGSTFRVYLPVRPLRPSAPYPSPYATGAVKQPLRVLVADGRSESREAVVQPLRASGYEVVDVPNTRSAVEVLASDDIDLLITASRLPDGTGAVLARSARSVRPSLRVVVVSEKPETNAAFDDVLLEPLDEGRLLQSVRAALGGVAGEG